MPERRGRKFIKGTVDQYLVGIAEGLRRAQEELSRVHVSRPGESPITYQIPSLEFELKLSLEMSEVEETEGPSPEADRPAPGRDVAARFPPWLDIDVAIPEIRGQALNPEVTATETFQAEAASTIRGKFTAVPANGGAPIPILSLSARTTDAPDRMDVVARLRNALGETLEGEEVEFNVDREYSEHLNWVAVEEGKLDEGDVELPQGTRIETAVAATGPEGEAATRLRLTGVPGQQVAIVVFAAGLSEVLVHEIPED